MKADDARRLAWSTGLIIMLGWIAWLILSLIPIMCPT